MIIALFLALLTATLAFGGWLGARLTRAGHEMRCAVDEVAICSEADRAERGLYMDWRL